MNSFNDADAHRYARNARGDWVNARTVPFNKHAVYFCECPSKHRLKHVKPSGKHGKRHFSDYFAHITTGSKRKRDTIACGSGGESMQHRIAKHMLRELVNTVSFAESQCPNCYCRVLLNLENCTIRLEMKSDDGLWRYDCMAYNEDGVKFYALEVVNTHYSGQKKVESTRQDGLGIAEFLVSDVMQLGRDHRTILNNLLTETKLCHSCNMKRIDQDCLWFYEKEQWGWIELESLMFIAMNDAFERAKLICQLKLCSDSLEQARLIIDHSLDRSYMYSGIHGNIELDQGCFNWQSYGFTIDQYVIIMMDDMWDRQDGRAIHATLKSLCNARNTCIHCIMAMRINTVINTFQRTPQDECMKFNNCLFPILMQIQTKQNICANCGIFGHSNIQCYKKTCYKCSFGRRFLHCSII